MDLGIITKQYFNNVYLYFEIFFAVAFFIIVKIMSESYGISALFGIMIFLFIPLISSSFFSYLSKNTKNDEFIKMKHISKSDMVQYTILSIIFSTSITISTIISITKVFQTYIPHESTWALSTISSIPDYSAFIISILLTSISTYCIYYKCHKHHHGYSQTVQSINNHLFKSAI